MGLSADPAGDLSPTGRCEGLAFRAEAGYTFSDPRVEQPTFDGEHPRPMTGEKDIVLIHFEDKPLSFARIEGIEPDHKPGWYHVRLLLLQVPVQVVTWILRDAYIDGGEFTMNGKRMRLEKVESPAPAAPEAPAPEPKQPAREPGSPKVIPLAKLKKEK